MIMCNNGNQIQKERTMDRIINYSVARKLMVRCLGRT